MWMPAWWLTGGACSQRVPCKLKFTCHTDRPTGPGTPHHYIQFTLIIKILCWLRVNTNAATTATESSSSFNNKTIIIYSNLIKLIFSVRHYCTKPSPPQHVNNDGILEFDSNKQLDSVAAWRMMVLFSFQSRLLHLYWNGGQSVLPTLLHFVRYLLHVVTRCSNQVLEYGFPFHGHHSLRTSISKFSCCWPSLLNIITGGGGGSLFLGAHRL